MRLRGLLAGSLLFAAAAMGTAQQIQTTVNGQPVHFPDMKPMMMNNRVMVPLRGVFEQMGANVQWNAYTNTVSAMKGDKSVSMRVGDRYATVNGQTMQLDSPAVMMGNRVMVPLRFLSESFGAQVDWNPGILLASITTDGTMSDTWTNRNLVTLESGTVIPFTLDRRLSSNNSVEGDLFTGTIKTSGNANYGGLPAGTVVMGHVEIASPKTSENPGVLGLAFDRIKLPDGKTYAIDGSLISLDAKSVEMKNGKLVAKSTAKRDLKYVGIGAGAGALIAIVTKGNVLTTTLIGGALGYLYDELQRNPNKSKNVALETGTEVGLRLDRDATFNITSVQK